MAQADKVVTFPWDAQYRISQALVAGRFVFVSGQAAIDEKGEVVGEGDFLAQGRQAFANLGRVLEGAGSSLDHVVKVTIFVTDMVNFPQVVELRGEYFSEPYPADSIVEVRALALPALAIEIEAIATLADEKGLLGRIGDAV
jgi:reactive intermediate/imine deaminase